MQRHPYEMDRRTILKSFAAGAAAIGPGMALTIPGAAGAAAKVTIKYDWLISNGQIGDVVAVENGYFEEAGFEVEFSPGGPNSQTVPPVISGAATLGQFSETTQLFHARASGVPVKILACGYRTGPYAFTSKPAKPLRTAADLAGLRIGVQPTARFIIDAIAAKNGIDLADLTIVSVGFDKGPLVRDEVDTIGGWITNTQALSVVGEDRVDLLVRDLGLPSYANTYFATDEAIETNADTLADFIGAAAKGWGWTHANPEEAVRKTVEAYPALSLEWELRTIGLVLDLSFDSDTARDGWGTFAPALLEEQLSIFEDIGQFPSGRPALDEVYTSKILEMTADRRPRLGSPVS